MHTSQVLENLLVYLRLVPEWRVQRVQQNHVQRIGCVCAGRVIEGIRRQCWWLYRSGRLARMFLKDRDRLWLAVFKNTEVFLAEAWNRLTVLVRHYDIDNGQARRSPQSGADGFRGSLSRDRDRKQKKSERGKIFSPHFFAGTQQ